jgi:hypothetical protein
MELTLMTAAFCVAGTHFVASDLAMITTLKGNAHRAIDDQALI